MRKIIVLILMFTASTAWAWINPTVIFDIKGYNDPANEFYLGNHNCFQGNYSIYWGSKNPEGYPIFPGKFDNLDIQYSDRYYREKIFPQALPASCQVQLENYQTLIISGTLRIKGEPGYPPDQAFIEGLQCKHIKPPQ